LWQIRGKARRRARAVLAYGDKRLNALTKKMAQAPQGVNNVSILIQNAKVLKDNE
jgi:hypothetical protein